MLGWLWLLLFFFSSRRRHTRFDCDWSSDVCSSDLKIVGQTPVQMGLALATYVYGRATDTPKASHFGMDMLRAQIVAEALTEALKISTHRERPNHENHQSFPSGHASITFASATVIERHLG